MVLSGNEDNLMQKADMHVHLGSIEQTFNDRVKHGPEKLGGLYQKVCRAIANHMVHPMAAEYFSVDLPKIDELFIRLNHDPGLLFELAMRAGMDYLAVTDHDTIDPVVRFLGKYHNLVDRVIVGEEVTTHYKDGIHLHVGVYGLSQTQHKEIQEARRDMRRELIPYLNGQGLLYSLNHPFQVPVSRRGNKLTYDDMVELRELFRVVEKRNGLIPERLNELAESFFRDNASIGGSDSHRRNGVGRTYTAAYADSKEEFLEAISDGRGEVRGAHGTVWQNILEILDKISSYGSVVRFGVPDEVICKIRLHMQNVLYESGDSLIRIDGHAIAAMPFRGRWRISEALMVLFSVVSSPMYAVALRDKESYIDEALLSEL